MSSVLSPIKQKFINTIVAYVENKPITCELTKEEINTILKYAKYHSMENIVYNGLKNSQITLPEGFIKYINTLFHKAIVQDAELSNISEKFIENKIYHLPLKGSVIRHYYPTLEARNMCDLDILVKEEDFEKVKTILLDLGYIVDSEGGNHDVYEKPPFMHLEIHRKMIGEFCDNSNYYDDIFERIVTKSGAYHLTLNPEDIYIFNIIHGGKHFSDGGTGLRILTDIYYIQKQFPNLNFTYINDELKKLELDTFGNILLNISNSLFSNLPLSTDEELVLDYLIDSGSYGTLEQSLTSELAISEKDASNNSKIKLVLENIFPPMSFFKRRNPILNKCPFLVPIFFFERLFKIIFNKKRRKTYVNNINNIDEEKLNRIKTIRNITKIKNKN